jgi:hypothetical protein
VRNNIGIYVLPPTAASAGTQEVPSYLFATGEAGRVFVLIEKKTIKC